MTQVLEWEDVKVICVFVIQRLRNGNRDLKVREGPLTDEELWEYYILPEKDGQSFKETLEPYLPGMKETLLISGYLEKKKDGLYLTPKCYWEDEHEVDIKAIQSLVRQMNRARFL